MSEDATDGSDDSGIDDSRFGSPRERLGDGADRAVAGFDERVVDILSWVLDTETRARIYVYLRQHPWSTSEEVAEGTGLYPSTVREALAELNGEETVERRKRESEGAGNNPYEYTAIAPSDLVGDVVGQVQDQLNALVNLDDHLGEREDGDTDRDATNEPVRIEVKSDVGDEDDDGDERDSEEAEE